MKKKVIGIICLIIAVVVIWGGYDKYQAYQAEKQQEIELQKELQAQENGQSKECTFARMINKNGKKDANAAACNAEEAPAKQEK